MRGPDSAAYERAARGVLPTSDLRSVRFRNDAVLKAVAAGRVRLGRPGDPSYPAPIRSSGTPVARVQQALVDLGYSLPRWGVDGRYGNETYQAVLLYKRNSNWKICNGWVGFLYLDMILGRTRNVVCKFEVGVPNMNFRGQVSDSFATEAAEDAAGSAGLDLQRRLRAGDPLGAAPDTVICNSFRRLMEAALKVVIPGAKVATVGTSRCP